MVNHGQGPSNPACTRPGCARRVRAARIKTKYLATQFGNGKRPACEAPVVRQTNTKPMEIINLNLNQVQKASGVLSAAFFEYPMFIFYFPDPKRRTRYLPWYFRNVLRSALSYGEVFTTTDISGVIFTLPPDHAKLTIWEYVQNGFFLTPFILGLRNYKRSMDCERFVGNTQKRMLKNRPHYYLWGLAVDPNQMAKGIGAALMQPVIEKADAEETPIYLETHVDNNVPYYQKHGFELIHITSIPKYDLPLWCMLREPRKTWFHSA
jgi:ribosomal protein S18 acetylase RimI-like enzyme